MYILAFDKGGNNPKISSFNDYSGDDYFDKQTINVGSETKDVLRWFDVGNNYPETTLSKINAGSTLQSILNELDVYVSGSGLKSDDAEINTYIDNYRNGDFELLNDVYAKCVNSFNRLGNSFVRVVTDENNSFVQFYFLQTQKCRLAKKGSQVWVNPDWTVAKKEKTIKIPTYPKFRKKTVNGSVQLDSILHIKNDVLGFDYYGNIPQMQESLLLNEKEHRRNNWQLSQIRRGFKRDFVILSEYGMREGDIDKYEKLIEEQAGDDKAGGVFSLSAENGKIQALQADFNFDFTKDDTPEQLFRLWGFPRSLVGIKSGASFSVEQVESDYDQFLPKVEKMQSNVLTPINRVFLDILKVKSNLQAINIPPSVILQNYMQYMNDEQKALTINKVLKRYGIE